MINDNIKASILLSGLNTILENSLDIIFIKNTQLHYIAASKPFVELVGAKSESDLIGKIDADIFGAALANRYVADDKRVIDSGMPILNHIEPLPDIDGQKQYSSTSKFAIKAADGKVIGLCGIAHDVTAEVALETERENSELTRKIFANTTQRLKRSAQTDSLTGLLNRKSTLEQIHTCIDKEGTGNCHTLLFLDLDSFKEINDRYGHLFGDKVLCDIANKLKQLFNANDIVGRVGGDEFLILLKDMHVESEIEHKVKSLFSTVSMYSNKNDGGITVSCSIGAAIHCNGKTVEQLYDEADKAMYLAKKNGKKHLAFYRQEK